MVDVAIVGAGAAGLATAIFTCRLDSGVTVALLDGATKPGAKILVSGGSRCNVTNTTVTEADFQGGRRAIIRRILRAFPVPDTIAFFDEIGVPLHEEAGGKLFPDSHRSRDVLDALLREAAARGTPVQTGHRVHAIERTADGFRLTTSQGPLAARAVVLATGGRSLPKSGSDGAGLDMAGALGHTIVPTTPALVPMVLAPGAEAIHERLSGVALEAELTLRVGGAVTIRLRGALLWTHFGISGPVALDMSRHWLRARLDGHPAALTASFCPGESFDALDARWTRLAAERPKASLHNTLAGFLPASMASVLLDRLALAPDTPLAHLSRDARRRLVHALVEWPLEVTGTRGYAYAEVTAGGVALEEINPSTLESRVCPGLFLVGEVLDVDGRIGGFNFQWAWSSAYVAARGLARRRARHMIASRPPAAGPDDAVS
ncbi:MAG: NAD(P)/FAD-dependent oxidoreductase [Acidobacteriota bacterium]|nr:NAD(P)/FAD-dependent oxidoreductase [Acidobacteriota bacterium]